MLTFRPPPAVPGYRVSRRPDGKCQVAYPSTDGAPGKLAYRTFSSYGEGVAWAWQDKKARAEPARVTPPPIPPPTPSAPSAMIALADRYCDEVQTLRNVTSKHKAETRSKLKRILSLAGIRTLVDWRKLNVDAALCKLMAGGSSLQTLNSYIIAARAFGRWLAEAFEIREVKLKNYNAQPDRRYQRTIFEPEQFAQLIHATEQGPRVQGIDGADAAAAYLVTCYTGLRSSTVRQLEVRHFTLEGANPGVSIEAHMEKQKRPRFIELPLWLAARLRVYFAGKLPPAAAFRLPAKGRAASKMLRTHLRLAGLVRSQWEKRAKGEKQPGSRRKFWNVLDWHSLRGSYAVWLLRTGAPEAVVQKLMGHASFATTFKHYANFVEADRRGAVERLPGMVG